MRIQRERVRRLEPRPHGLAALTIDGRALEARVVVPTPPVGRSVELLRTLRPSTGRLEAAIEMLAGVSTVRCLALMAGYPSDVPRLPWDVCYPDASDMLQLVSRDSRERGPHARPAFVFRAVVGVAGEATAPGGGIQAAWISGRRLASRLLEERTTWT